MTFFELYVGEVRPGYGRGSKKLGFPTANFPDFSSELKLPSNNVQRGVYYGYCMVEKDRDQEQIRPCVTNIGLAPTFQDVRKVDDTWIMETFIIGRPRGLPDFYERKMKLLLLGFIRPEMKFDSVEELITQITMDVETASKLTISVLSKNKAAIKKAFQDFSLIQPFGSFIQIINK
ncbi:hypothetical protein EON65_24340 [archaeon]|nr:MAG: hypothetical protein EON65_24340 [archaeon]